MNSKEIIQYFSVSNGLYYVKRTPEDYFYILTESNEWRYAPSLADEFYDILSGYVEISEEAMNELIRARNETARHQGAMENSFTIKDPDCVFRIVCNTMDEPTDTTVFNDGYSRLDITTYEGSNLIHSIECIYVDDVEECKYYLRDYSEIEGIKRLPDLGYCYHEDDDRILILNLDGAQLDIMLSECLKATYYYADGRVEYYYDEQMRLLYIKVKNLSAEEYRYFKSISYGS